MDIIFILFLAEFGGCGGNKACNGGNSNGAGGYHGNESGGGGGGGGAASFKHTIKTTEMVINATRYVQYQMCVTFFFSNIAVNTGDEDSGKNAPGSGGAPGNGQQYSKKEPALVGSDGLVVIINLSTGKKTVSL